MADRMADDQIYGDPRLEADIVMKGGVTSGIVYPRAVCQLARRYRFRSVGGTSAGAIAAAAAAAAEYGRSRGGFVTLSKVPDELAESEGGRTKLLRLFQADPSTRTLFDLALGLMQPKRSQKAMAVARLLVERYWPWLVIGVVLAIAVGVLISVWAAPYPIIAALAVVLARGWVQLKRDVTALPDNHFGLCRLGPQGSDGDQTKPLTPWLHETLQDLADTEPPLTFADLWGAPQPGPEPSEDERSDHERWLSERADRERCIRECERDPELRKVNLEVMTTDLAHGLPLRLPIAPDEPDARLADGENRLLIDLEEFAKFFPDDVITYLADHAKKLDPEIASRIGAGERKLVQLPSAELPVIVAARMSLSFPGLISAVPLWRVRPDRDGPKLERILISDGGITSNFPVHFFDSPLPRRPTFALNLAGFGPDEPGDPDEPADNVRPPDAPGAPEPWQPFAHLQSLGEFFVAIKDAMQNWRDNSQARLPGFRERVIHIRMRRNEGGLNLSMDAERITRLAGRGSYAGECLVETFSGPVEQAPRKTEHWNDTRFTRFRVAMQGTERHLAAFRRGYVAEPDEVSTSYPDRIEEGLHSGPYRFGDEDVLAFARGTARRYERIVSRWEDRGRTLNDPNAPKPAAIMRVVPPA